ncbi:hypothetical protein IAD21_03223 [Abditibacteriota bacterium]|nr:hypothetical protein IAD21_03223 [Abditibacteriota bacterium]
MVLLVFSCLFWLASAALGGLCAAFFWRDLEMDALTRRRLTFRSVAITWVLTFPLICNWIILGWPYLLIFRLSVDRGIKFWNSNRPRQWLGDFSDLGPSDKT